MNQEVLITEPAEKEEVIGPGQLLSEARMKIGLTQQQIADKLNFKVSLVKAIEEDEFDHSLPLTFNRGYLRNFAKLVEIDVDKILTRFEALDKSEKSGSKLQSFSKGTEKQAQHNRIMWMSYLILAGLIGMTLLWFFQSDSQINPVLTTDSAGKTQTRPKDQATVSSSGEVLNKEQTPLASESLIVGDVKVGKNEPNNDDFVALSETLKAQTNAVHAQSHLQNSVSTEDQAKITEPLSEVVVFKFSGDCWVNIYDATGERVAWGVKKSGYEMTIEGVPPFQITLGKPELVTIKFQEKFVDLSAYSQGNIAKFALPKS